MNVYYFRKRKIKHKIFVSLLILTVALIQINMIQNQIYFERGRSPSLYQGNGNEQSTTSSFKQGSDTKQKERLMDNKLLHNSYIIRDTVDHIEQLENNNTISVIEQRHSANSTSKNYFLLIGVISSASHYGLRKIIRHNLMGKDLMNCNTNITMKKPFWVFTKENSSEVQVKVIFVAGQSPNSTVRKIVLQEQRRYNDIIIGDFLDTYHNLTLKSMFLLRYCTYHYPQTNFLLKIDDNVRLNLTLLLQRLSTYDQTDIVIGHILTNFPPVRNVSSKWYVSEKDYPYAVYPSYAAGPAYIIGGAAARKILKVCGDVHVPFYIEDVFVTGMCRNKSGIEYQHEEHICYDVYSKQPSCAVEHREKTDFLLKISSQFGIE